MKVHSIAAITYRVQVASQKGRLESTGSSVQDDTPGNQKGSQFVRHAGQSLNCGSTTEQQHGCDNDVGAEAKEEEGQVSRAAPSGVDNLGNRVGRRRDLLQVDGQDTEEKNLDSGTRSIPVQIEQGERKISC